MWCKSLEVLNPYEAIKEAKAEAIEAWNRRAEERKEGAE